jgi:TolA-binding protein
MSADLEDLSVRARRGLLDRAELRKFEASLSASPEDQLLHRAGCEFDAESSILPGDETIAARIARRALAPRIARRRWPRVARFAIAAAILLGAAVVTAAVSRWLAKPRATLALVPASPAAELIEKPSAPAEPTVADQESVELVQPAPAPAPPPSRRVTRSRAITPEPVASAAPRIDPQSSTPMTAAELFAAAARARARGEAAKAIELYAALQSVHPSSPEARESQVAIAMLQLRSGAHAAAVEHFRKYLATDSGGALASDALWGEAQALAKLGRTDEARRACETLLRRYPDSAYAEAARAQIEALAPKP